MLDTGITTLLPTCTTQTLHVNVVDNAASLNQCCQLKTKYGAKMPWTENKATVPLHGNKRHLHHKHIAIQIHTWVTLANLVKLWTIMYKWHLLHYVHNFVHTSTWCINDVCINIHVVSPSMYCFTIYVSYIHNSSMYPLCITIFNNVKFKD